jgi:hypothetical protein
MHDLSLLIRWEEYTIQGVRDDGGERLGRVDLEPPITAAIGPVGAAWKLKRMVLDSAGV